MLDIIPNLLSVDTEPPRTGNVRDLTRKDIPFPAPKAHGPLETAECQSRVTIQIGSQQYAVDISCKATELTSLAPNRSAGGIWRLVETLLVRLREAVALGDLMAGWRVRWPGG